MQGHGYVRRFRSRVNSAVWPCVLLAGAAIAAPVRIASVGPLSGGLSAIGTELQRGAQLAVQARAAEFAGLGLELDLATLDDTGDPAVGQSVARAILNDPAILGVVGAYNSGVSNVLGRELAAGPVAVVSPGSTADGLTKQGWAHFSRVVAPNGAQSGAAVEYLAQDVRPKAVFVLSDNTTYGNDLTRGFRAAAAPALNVVGFLGANTDAQLRYAVSRVVRTKADVVYFGGTLDTGVRLLKLLRASGSRALVVGGDGLDSPDLVSRAGPDASGVVFTTVFGPIKSFANRAAFARQYVDAYKSEATGLSVFAYDAANTLLTAVLSAARESGEVPSRARVAAALRRTTLGPPTAVSGPVAFEADGERRGALLFLTRVGGSPLQPQLVRVLRARTVQPSP